MDNENDTVDYSETIPTLDDWLYAWEAAVEAGQSTITRDEATQRYYERYPESQDLGENGGIKCDMKKGPCAPDCTGFDWKPIEPQIDAAILEVHPDNGGRPVIEADASDEIDDAGPAFPVKHLDSELYYPGLTIRDWFAGQVLPALIYPKTYEVEKPTALAKLAYSVADAMIKERNK